MSLEKENKKNFLVLVTLDGWGVKESGEGNVFSQAHLPTFKELISSYPVTTLNLSSSPKDYRLEKDLSEIGYYILGTGHEDHNYLTRINRSIKNKKFYKNPALKKAMENSFKKNTKLHLWGLLSEEEKYSSFKHLEALLFMAKEEGVKKIYLHIVLDGVDTPRDRGLENLKKLKKLLARLGVGEIATISGRFYAMDRNGFWEKRIAKSYKAMTGEEGNKTKDSLEAIKKNYEKNIYDKEIAPTIVTNSKGEINKIEEGDSIILFNFRGDRSRSLAKILTSQEKNKIQDCKQIKDLLVVTFTEYEENTPAKVAFPFFDKFKSLGERIKENNLKEFRIAEINKFIHLTKIMDGYREYDYSSQNKHLLFSSKKDQNLALMETTNKIAEKIILESRESKYNFIMANLANFDLSAREGNFSTTVKYVELLDKILKKIIKSVLNKNGTLIITSTAGWAENMINKKTEEINQDYTFSPLPIIIINKQLEGKKMNLEDPVEGDLSLIKPQNNFDSVYYTILKILGINSSEEENKSLL